MPDLGVGGVGSRPIDTSIGIQTPPNSPQPEARQLPTLPGNLNGNAAGKLRGTPQRRASLPTYAMPMPDPGIANPAPTDRGMAPEGATADRSFSFSTDHYQTSVAMGGQNSSVNFTRYHNNDAGSLGDIAPGVDLAGTERQAHAGVRQLDGTQGRMMNEVGEVMNIGNRMQLQMAAMKVIQDLITALSKVMSKMGKAVSDMA